MSSVLTMRRELDGELPAPVWPEGISIRTFRPADGEAVQALLDEAYRGWDARYTPLAYAHWARAMIGDSEFDPALWFLAERDAVLAGCALHWRSGWLKDLAVRDGERGRGIGRALVLTGLRACARRSIPRVGLKVDAANPTGAQHLYESLGFVIESQDEL